jgi:hypothetical protein
MVTDLISQSTTRLDQRFYLTALIPTAVFVPAIAAVIIESWGSISGALDWYSNLPVSLQLAILAGAAACIWFVATLLTSQLWNLVRLYEGYPLDKARNAMPELARFLGTSYHRRQLIGHMEQAEQETKREHHSEGTASVNDPTIRKYERYPSDPHRVLPTSLGNLIRSDEDYAALRYDFEIISLWPRLATVLPTDHLQDVERAEIEYQTPLVVSFWSFVLAGSSLALAASAVVPAELFVAIFLGSMASSWVFYRLSFSAARDYGDLLTSAVDLYHNDLLERWWPELLQIEDGRGRMRALEEFVREGRIPQPIRVAAADEHSTANEDGSGVRRLYVSFVRIAGLIARSVGLQGQTSSAMDNLSRSELSSRANASASESATGPSLPKKPGFGLRISWLVLIVALFGAYRGYRHLNEPVWVLQAKEDVSAFTQFDDDNVQEVAIERGEAGPDAIVVASSDEDLSPDDLAGRVAVRRVVGGATIEKSDVAPGAAETNSTDKIVELDRRRSEVRALDLRAGDEVDLVSSGRSRASPSACGNQSRTSSSPDIPARIVAIVASWDARSVSVVLALDADDLTRWCIAGADDVEIVRHLT